MTKRKWGELMKTITKIEEIESVGPAKKIRVAAYCRVSSSSDDQLISLETQKAHYETYIRANPEWEFAGLYYDEGISGTKTSKREGLLSMLKDCGRGKIDYIVTKSISRFARNTADCLTMVRKLLELDIPVFFEKENINTASMESELMLSILSSMAESESVSISQNAKWSIQRRFKNGTFIIACPPYGYDNVDGELVVVPEQAVVVKRIFADALAGKGTHMIARELNSEGLPPIQGKKWHPGTIKFILKNEKYTGDVIFQKTYTDSSFNRHRNNGEYDQYFCENHHEPIISHEDFDKVNELLRQRGKEKGNGEDTAKYNNRYGFSGRIKCGECGSTFKRRMHYKPSGAYVAWCCGRHIDSVDACSMKYITDDALKAAFLTMMNKLVFSHKVVLKPLLNDLITTSDSERLQQISELENQIEKNVEQKQVLTDLMTSVKLSPALFHKVSNELNTEAEMLSKKKEGLLYSMSCEYSKVEELKLLMQFTAKNNMVTEFTEELFLAYVDRVTVVSRAEVMFELKCGLNLKERLVK